MLQTVGWAKLRNRAGLTKLSVSAAEVIPQTNNTFLLWACICSGLRRVARKVLHMR